uniref:Uncharacterized protein n=1 Tax=Haptolina brevifila TaxID=156173 RepID=A0A7S2FQC7_9EUKA|mmetsp:Transcript_16786/g.33855  ORF Transcript_16786/g.33855 Transcript_16786/m.33855 type:complete len:323 (+) Transcript_16786:414-1382(+)
MAFAWFLEYWAAGGRASAEKGRQWLLGVEGLGVEKGVEGGVESGNGGGLDGDRADVAEGRGSKLIDASLALPTAPPSGSKPRDAKLADAKLADATSAESKPTASTPPEPTPAVTTKIKKTSWGDDDDDDDDDLPPPPPRPPSPPTPPPPRMTPMDGCTPPMELVSLDLQPSWGPYVQALHSARGTEKYTFHQWNINGGIDALTASGLPALDLCIISNVLVYCTDQPTADVLHELLTTHRVHAILINERGAEQKMVDMLEQRGVVVVRLMDNNVGGRDDRQLLLLPPGSSPPPCLSAGSEGEGGGEGGGSIFPNVPYEEGKHM